MVKAVPELGLAVPSNQYSIAGKLHEVELWSKRSNAYVTVGQDKKDTVGEGKENSRAHNQQLLLAYDHIVQALFGKSIEDAIPPALIKSLIRDEQRYFTMTEEPILAADGSHYSALRSCIENTKTGDLFLFLYYPLDPVGDIASSAP